MEGQLRHESIVLKSSIALAETKQASCLEEVIEKTQTRDVSYISGSCVHVVSTSVHQTLIELQMEGIPPLACRGMALGRLKHRNCFCLEVHT